MQGGNPDEWAELHRALGTAVAKIDALTATVDRHTTASTFALVFLMQELEARGGLDRAALAEATIAGLRLANPTADAEMERAVRDLFGQGEGQAPAGPLRPGLRLIKGGKSTTSSARSECLVALPDPT